MTARQPGQLPEPTEADLALADLMSESWANFAKTGDPNIAGQPQWHPYTAENGELFVYDYECVIKNNFDRRLQEIINACCFRQLDEFRASRANKLQ